VSTAPTHIPVLLEPAIDALRIRNDGFYVDGTFGRGGHSRAILARLGPQGRLLALDRDPQAVAEGMQLAAQEPRFSILHSAFSGLGAALCGRQVDGILLDLGISSPQIDQIERGFSFRGDAPLDMRMDTSQGLSAADWLNQAPQDEIARVIHEYGEERFARQIATAIVAARQQQPFSRTRQLAELVASKVRTREPGQDPATRTFQAIRIHVNGELAELAAVLPQAIEALAPGGRLAVISFHSLEDRQVKHRFRDEAKGAELPPEIPVAAQQLSQGRLRLIGKPVRPDAAECAANPRARSAILRVAERMGVAA